MNNTITQECFINGIQYKCRTCFDPGQTVYPLENECSDGRAWRDLLRDIAQLQIDDNNFLPKTVCNKCLDKLLNYYDFILQIHRVEKKYAELLATCNDPLHFKVKDEIIKLEDYTVNDIPLEHSVLEIKLEDEMIAPFDIVLANSDEKSEQNEEKNKTKEDPAETTSTIPKTSYNVIYGDQKEANTSGNHFTPWEISPSPKLPITNRKGRKTKAFDQTNLSYKYDLVKSIGNNKKSKVPPEKKHRTTYYSSDSDQNVNLKESTNEEEYLDVPPIKDSLCNYCDKACTDDAVVKSWVSCLQCEHVWAHNDCIPKSNAIFICYSCN